MELSTKLILEEHWFRLWVVMCDVDLFSFMCDADCFKFTRLSVFNRTYEDTSNQKNGKCTSSNNFDPYE